ncbi:hypothetical protein JOC95_003044 [Bacillus tianshenii]|uniref:Uncharacterized protein n=1 Tax=Sutcliffiella tianshenii TaxID=1463404 RepID=A0ABS2P2T6_9BACI|nr:hypothetical protein [Bacillus tianshenii]
MTVVLVFIGVMKTVSLQEDRSFGFHRVDEDRFSTG